MHLTTEIPMPTNFERAKDSVQNDVHLVKKNINAEIFRVI